MTISAARSAHEILSISIRWMDRLRLPAMFLVRGLLYVIAVAAVGHGLYLHLNRFVQSPEQELSGIEHVRRITKTMQLMQSHRGLSAALFGSDTLRSDFAKNEIALQANLKCTAQLVAAGTPLRDEWQRIETAWDRELEAQGRDFLSTAGEFRLG